MEGNGRSGRAHVQSCVCVCVCVCVCRYDMEVVGIAGMN
jgi:hypothetical protein